MYAILFAIINWSIGLLISVIKVLSLNKDTPAPQELVEEYGDL